METLFPERISHSMLYDLWGCKHKWFRSYCQRLLTPRTDSPDLKAGVLFAKGCEVVRMAYYNDEMSLADSIELGYNYILDGEDTGDTLKSNPAMAKALKRYFHTYPLTYEYIPAKLADGTHAIEYEFEITLPVLHPETNKPLVYTGKLDAVMRRMVGGTCIGTYVMDEKTTKSIYRVAGTKYIDEVKYKNEYLTCGQLIGYAWALSHVGVNVDGGIISKIPISKEPEDPFRIEITITQFAIEQWFVSLVSQLSEMVERYISVKAGESQLNIAFPPVYHRNMCSSFGEACRYTFGCQMEEGESILSQMYPQKIDDWRNNRIITLQDYKLERGIK